jgi:transposase-like protein
MTCDLTDPIFSNEAKALEHMENDRWPGGEATCPLCGVVGEAKKMGGKTQAGMWLCSACRGKFTVRTGTVFERSHIPLHKWLLATHLMASSKKGISAHQLHRMLGITYKSAWFMCHRIREAMAPAASAGPLGGDGKIVEMDEMYLLKAPLEQTTLKTDGTPFRSKRGKGPANKNVVVALVERGGASRSFHIRSGMDKATVDELVAQFIRKDTRLHTDESHLYKAVGKNHPIKHETVNHGKGEYARGDVTTNSVEGHFGVFTRGLVGTYQHMSEQHLSRYLAEFDFRQSNRSALGVTDVSRANRILKGAEGKRLTYRQTAH